MSRSTDLILLRNRIQRFVEKAWGTRVYSNRWERAMRILEEAIELAQAEGIEHGLAEELVARVYSRPKGDILQEYAGVGVTWLAGTSGVSIELEPGEILEREIKRVEQIVETDVERLREKHRDKARYGFAIPPFTEEWKK